MNIIKHNFGSYSGFVTHLQSAAAAVAGIYRSAAVVDWARVSRLVFVCKGNVCRSPYAEVRTTALNVPSASFGLDTTGNVPANPVAQRVATARGIDLSAHRSAQFDTSKIEPSDLLVAFEPGHFKTLTMAATGAQATLLGLWCRFPRRPYIADPYGKSEEYFRSCFTLIDQGIEGIVERVREATTAS